MSGFIKVYFGVGRFKRGGQQEMANLDEQLWQACFVEDWVQAAFLLEAGAGTEWRSEEVGTTAIMRAAMDGRKP